jgi:TonB family protein
MRVLSGIAISILLATVCSNGQQPNPTAPIPDKDGVYSVAAGVQIPVVVERGQAVYPKDQPSEAVEGESVHSLVVRPDGSASDIEIVRSHGGTYDRAAADAIRQSKFSPGIVDGKPVPVRIYSLTRFFADGRPAFPRIQAHFRVGAVPPTAVKVYAAGSGVTAPELLPTQTLEITQGKCKEKHHDTVTFFVIVDSEGAPRTYYFIHPLGNSLDNALIQLVARDRFKPGTREGSPVAVASYLEMDVESCVEHFKDYDENKVTRSRLGAQPNQRLGPFPKSLEPLELVSNALSMPSSEELASGLAKVGGSVTAPTPLRSVEAKYSKEAKEQLIQGICLVSLVVDSHGMPVNPRLVKSAGYGLDEKAIEAVNLYRFHPAMKSGMPVPVLITVEVNFRLY